MTIVSVSAFAQSSIAKLSPAAQRLVVDAMTQLAEGDIDDPRLRAEKLQSGQGYVLRVRGGLRMTVLIENSDSVVIDDVFPHGGSASKDRRLKKTNRLSDPSKSNPRKKAGER